MEDVFFSDWENLIRILIIAPLLYLLVIFYIRIFGKRSNSQMNNFDWIVTVAVGSIFSSTVTFKEVTLTDGAIAIFALLFLQYLVNRMMLKSDLIKMLVRSTPQLLLYDGKLLKDNMKKERILESEVWAAIRENGLKSKNQVHAVVFETDAKLSVIAKKDNSENDSDICFSLANVQGLPDGLKSDLKGQKHETEFN